MNVENIWCMYFDEYIFVYKVKRVDVKSFIMLLLMFFLGWRNR